MLWRNNSDMRIFLVANYAILYAFFVYLYLASIEVSRIPLHTAATIVLQQQQLQQQQEAPWKNPKRCLRTLPFGVPSRKEKEHIICRNAYILDYDDDAKIPVWVAYTQTPEHTLGCFSRSDYFAEDMSLAKESRSTRKDYLHSGLDTGHMANNEDMSWDLQVQKESFYLSNMSPQYPNFNRGVWKNLEAALRAQVFFSGHSHSIYIGNIYYKNNDKDEKGKGKGKKIGEGGVVVPDALYKISIDLVTGELAAFLIPNEETLKNLDFNSYRVQNVSIIEQESGVMLPSFFTMKTKALLSALPNFEDVSKFYEIKKQHCAH